MTKVIFNGKNGLSNSLVNNDNQYSVGVGIDPFRSWGFLKPSVNGTTINENWSSYIIDMSKTNEILALSDDQKIYSIDTANNTATKVHDTPAATATYGLCAYQTNISSNINPYTIFYFYGTTAGLYDGTNFTDNWMGTVPSGAGSLGTFAKPFIWQNFMMVGYTTATSHYIAKFDGTNGANGTLTAQWFDIGSNWSITSFFTYYNYLGVVVTNDYSYESQILLLDGSSTSIPVKRITSPSRIYGSFNINNDIFIITLDSINILGDNGLEKIKELTFENKNSIGNYYTFNSNHYEYGVYNDKIYFSRLTPDNSDSLFVFGRKDNSNQYIISQLTKPTGTGIYMIKDINGLLFVSSIGDGPSYNLQYFSPTATTNSTATLKYPFKDFGQKVRINYVKFYFKPLESGDSITVGLDTNYGTSTSLGTIDYSTYGAITEKRFELKKLCHAFRPTVSWTSGGTAISKIIVDYDFVDDI